jgi:hypothetical protein
MSLLKYSLTSIEERGLVSHGLSVNEHSQLSDCFRLGIKWALENPELLQDSEHRPLSIIKTIPEGE